MPWARQVGITDPAQQVHCQQPELLMDFRPSKSSTGRLYGVLLSISINLATHRLVGNKFHFPNSPGYQTTSGRNALWKNHLRIWFPGMSRPCRALDNF